MDISQAHYISFKRKKQRWIILVRGENKSFTLIRRKSFFCADCSEFRWRDFRGGRRNVCRRRTVPAMLLQNLQTNCQFRGAAYPQKLHARASRDAGVHLKNYRFVPPLYDITFPFPNFLLFSTSLFKDEITRNC